MNTYENWNKVVHTPLDPRIVLKLDQGKNRPKLDYISGSDMEVLLTQAFGPFFNIKYSDPVLRKFSPCKRKYKDWNTKQDVIEDYFPKEVVEVKCTLEIPMVNPATGHEHMIVREGFGSAEFDATKEDMCTKSASTDALKKAAYSLGFALELSVGKVKGKATDEAVKAAANEKAWFNEVWFGTAWGPTTMAQYSKELDTIKQLCAAANIPTNESGKLAQKAVGQNAVLPCNIKAVINFFSSAIPQKEAA